MEEFRCGDCQHVTTTRMRRHARLALIFFIVSELLLVWLLVAKAMEAPASVTQAYYVMALIGTVLIVLALILSVALWFAYRVFLFPRKRCWKCGKRGVVITNSESPGV